MEMKALLQANCAKLLEQYRLNLDSIHSLQATLIQDILPSVQDELELSEEATSWARLWLEDTYTVFQIARRHKFTRSFAMESIRKILVWRLADMWPPVPLGPLQAVCCFPDNIRDPLGRPILLIKSTSLSSLSDLAKPNITQGFERLRNHLLSLKAQNKANQTPILQYVVLLDLAGLSMQSINIDLISWTLRETIPRFPGMLAAVFMINYSWAHSGLWAVVRRLLPAAALSRVFFPTQRELLEFFTPACLPADYGGNLPCSTSLEDPLRVHQIGVSTQPPSRPPSIQLPNSRETPPEPAPTFSARLGVPLKTSISPTSLLNPFFGYPAETSSSGSTSLRHGRRRKRDLARTLVVLLWVRWRSYIKVSAALILLVCAARLWIRKASLQGLSLRAYAWFNRH